MSSHDAQPALASPLRDFVLGLSDAVLVLDAAGRVVLANAAARRLMGKAASIALPAPLEDALGASAAARVQARLALAGATSGIAHAGAAAPGADPVAVTTSEGRSVRVALHRLDRSHWALHAQPAARSAGDAVESSRELIGMFWDSPFPVTVQDESFRLVAVNDAYVDFCGYPRERLLGLDPLLLQPEADRPRALETRRRLVEDFASGEVPPLLERRIIAADGRVRWFRAARRALADARGLLYLAVLQDCSDEHAAREQARLAEQELDLAVSQREQARSEREQLLFGQRNAERALALQAERTRAVLDSVLVGIVTVGAGGIEWMNRSARRMFGGELEEFAGRPIDIVASDDEAHPLRRADWADSLADGEARTFECRIAARDGRCFWVAGNVVATGREAGRQLTYALLDIQRRHEAEVQVAQARASLQRIIEMAPLAIVLYDARTHVVLQVNRTALAVIGKTPGEVIGTTPEHFLSPELARQLRSDLELALVSAELIEREYRTGAPGEERLWDARFLPLASAGQVLDQVLVVATDVTAQRAAEQARLDAAIAQREMLVKEVHHRIKNNLQGVAGLLQQTGARHPEMAAILGEVVRQVQAIAQVYGLQVGTSGPLRLGSVATAIVQSAGRSFEREIALSMQGLAIERCTLPEAEAIPIALTLNELLVNAVKHGTPGALACELHFDATRVRVAVSNPGRLPDGFDLAGVRSGVSGLGLVRALLPRRGAALALAQRGERVVAEIELTPPSVTLS